MKRTRSLLLGLALVAWATTPAASGPRPDDSPTPEILAGLRADGLLDLAALRAQGYRGDVNFPGLRLAPGPWPFADEAAADPDKAVGDALWMGDFPIRTPETVVSLCSWNGSLVVAAEREVYRWTGAAWQSLGARTNGPIHSAVAQGGDLVIGGDFTVAGGCAANRIIRFDGTQWHAVGLGLDDRVTVLGTYGTRLIAAGDFQVAGSVFAQRIAAWDGADWAPLAGGLGAGATTMAEYGGKLVVAGAFHAAGTVIVNHIAAWDGATWSPLQNGLDDEARTLAVHSGKLVAAGPFTTAGVAEVRRVAAWDGTAWTPFGDPLPLVYAQQSYFLCDNAGTLSLAMHDATHVRVLQWDGAAWRQIVLDTGLRMLGLCSVNGRPAAAMASPERTLIHLSNGRDSVLLEGPGLDGDVLASVMWNGSLVVAGTFSRVGNLAVGGIARWDGANWHALGGGLAYVDESHRIRALAVHGSELIAGGSFHQIGGVVATDVARWNGSIWAPLGTAYAQGQLGTGVHCLASYQGEVYAAGDFNWLVPGYGALTKVARLRSAGWRALQPLAWWPEVVRSMCVYGDHLYIGGCPWSGCEALARYDGTTCLSVAGASWDEPRLMRVHDGRLYVAGAAGEVKSWDGYVWRDVADRDDTVSLEAMEAYDGRLVLGGRFDTLAGTAARNIVAWDGSVWASLGSGVGRAGIEEGVETMVATPWGLTVGGDFWHAGGRDFRGLARWNEATATGTPPDVPPVVDHLAQNVPNPFNPTTRIRFALRASGPVDLRIFDLRGALVRTLASGRFEAGDHECTWNGLTDAGRTAPSGIYVYRLRTTAGDIARRMTLLR